MIKKQKKSTAHPKSNWSKITCEKNATGQQTRKSNKQQNRQQLHHVGLKKIQIQNTTIKLACRLCS